MATFENPATRESCDKLSINITQDLVQITPNNNPNDVCIDTTGGDSRRSTLTPRDQQRDFIITPTRELNGHVTQHTKDPDNSDYSSAEEDDDFEETCCTRCTDRTHGAACRFLQRHAEKVRYAGLGLLILMFAAYFVYACVNSVEGALSLIILTFTVLFIVLAFVIHKNFGDDIHARCCGGPCTVRFAKFWNYCRWVLYIAVFSGLSVFIALDVRHDPRRLTSLSGLVLLIFLGFIFSKHPSKIRWRPVIWGLLLQWIFGLLVLRWSVGMRVVSGFAELVVKFLAFADEGSKFVFGDPEYKSHPFAFQSLPVVVFFSSVISILYYIGFMQLVVKGMSWLMQVTMGTTAIESLASASNIFVSYVEVAPILVPYVKKLTRSELHAILTSGFATVAGSILALYIAFGAPAPHLMSACILSAPAALAMAKLNYPETKKSRTKTQKDVEIPATTECNFIEAAANGAMLAVKLVGGIAACLIAFLGIVGFVNGVLAWLGAMVGIEELNFKMICSYLLWPFAILMGVEVKDAHTVAGMLGWKIFVDEVLCYKDLGEAVNNGLLDNRSAVIATYACCGFGSLGAMGVALGAMLAITPPNRRGVITQLVVRALINGNIAAFMTACVAGLLYQGDDIKYGSMGSVVRDVNMTSMSPVMVV